MERASLVESQHPNECTLAAVEDDDVRPLLRTALESNERTEQIVAELASVIESLLQILSHKAELSEGHLKMIAKLRRHAKLATTPKIDLDNTTDKYAVENSPVDCASRMHLCHGRCCGFDIKLSRQDLREGKLEWQIDQPYHLAKQPTGYCVYQNNDSGFCGNYEHRPATCRRYDCREDKRVWLDFEAMIPAPMPEVLVTIRRNARPSSG